MGSCAGPAANAETAQASLRSGPQVAPRLPGTLSGLQPLIDRLIGVGPRPPFADGAEVVTHLLSLRATFPFNGSNAQTSDALRAGMAG